MNNQNNSEAGYIPGICNIGKAEIAKRQNAGVIGIVLSIMLILAVHFLKLSALFKLGIFIPVFITALGMLQAYYKFCVAFGMMGVFSFNGKGENVTIEQKEYLKIDRARAIKIIILSIVISGIIAIAYYLLPI